MANEKKGTGLFWLGKGTLGKDIRHGDEIPVGYISDDRMEEFKKLGDIGEKMAKALPATAEIGELRKEIARLKTANEALELENKGHVNAGKQMKSDPKAKELQEEIETMRSIISGLSEKYPDIEKDFLALAESGEKSKGLVGKFAGMFRK